MRMVYIFFRIILFVAPAVVSAQSLEHVLPEIESSIERTMLDGQIPSLTIAIVRDDQIVWTGGFGYSNLWARTPAVTSTVYLIGSTFKAMSTVALLQQMEAGKFSLDDAVHDYLGSMQIQGEHADEPVTFRHLLTHTSGLPADFGPFAVWGDEAPPTMETYLSSSLKVEQPPETGIIYSNIAYTLVGSLVERFSGASYKAYMQEHVFDPLEMTNTAFAPTPAMTERLAIPYIIDENTGRPVPTVRLKAAVWPAGIVYGTVIDQARWLIANLNDGVYRGRQIIRPETLQEMHTRQFEKFTGPIGGIWGGDEAGYGLTWWTEQRGGEQYFAHSGSVPGYTAFLQGNRDRKIGVALLSNGNRSHPFLIELTDRVMRLVMDTVEKK